MTGVPDALERVREQIALAARRAGREPDEVTLVAICKGVPPERIREAAGAGQQDFGENRVQEAVEKFLALQNLVLRWHFVGRLQRNKVRRVLEYFHLIHSVDRISLVEEIAKRAAAPVAVLLEVNTSGEPGKGGVSPEDLMHLAEAAAGSGLVRVEGLMTMAPLRATDEESRRCFRKLAMLREEMRRRFPDLGIHHLSMGMSQDYVVAVEEGSTMLRVGRAIFGAVHRGE